MRRLLGLVLCLGLTGCALRPGVIPARSVPVPPAPAPPPVSLTPLRFPTDDGPHRVLSEWWYYTGHLVTATGQRFGFQLVFFKSERARRPVGYAAHFAITDHQAGRFSYAQRRAVGPPLSPGRYAVALGDWRVQGENGTDTLVATMPGYALTLTVTPLKPPVLHNGTGVISFGPAGDSAYYSRTRLRASGQITTPAGTFPVEGSAWMDHQWGNFISAGGGWDWYAIQLDDGSDLMLSVVFDAAHRPLWRFGTFVSAEGEAVPLADWTAIPLGTWTSPRSGAVYPSGWQVTVPAHDLSLTLAPVLPDQELDTRESTGTVYWEGEARVAGTQRGRPVGGWAYVELVGYAPAP